MKFFLTTQIKGEEETVLPNRSNLNSSPMNSGSKISSHQPVAPKRTINEAGTIVLTPGNEGEPSHLLGESSLADESQDEAPNKKRKALRTKKFRSDWLSFEMFKGWLRAHPNPERAMCTACNIVLNAGKSELEKHATSIKHQKRMMEYKQHSRFDYENDEPNVILVDPSGTEGEEGGSSFLQRHEQTEGSTFTPEGGYIEPITIDMSQIHHVPTSRKPPEPASFVSKAVVTKPAPPWKATAIVNGHVTRLELNDYKGRYLILFFYPQDFSAVCPTELLALSDRVLEFRALQTEIVACSVDSHLTHLAWARTPRAEGGLGNPKIPLLADPTHSIARDYGILLPDLGHTLRAHFIIDRRGVLRHMQINDLGVGRSIDELLRITQALQHVDETETGCPADWKPGMPNV
uniref:thioredoxin-dependent peroxiredoxin n=1 Tax=Cuerna arida TaxID=1464854 RepID=A0A1B6FZR7_9HEMI